mmetsp:Transcript_39092/g.103317  ORF Transcript_39092/g.103317 Transcript_39092/m.103317 type:complete len:201 (-) Transcript_39092:33-635(-)
MRRLLGSEDLTGNAMMPSPVHASSRCLLRLLLRRLLLDFLDGPLHVLRLLRRHGEVQCLQRHSRLEGVREGRRRQVVLGSLRLLVHLIHAASAFLVPRRLRGTRQRENKAERRGGGDKGHAPAGTILAAPLLPSAGLQGHSGQARADHGAAKHCRLHKGREAEEARGEDEAHAYAAATLGHLCKVSVHPDPRRASLRPLA